MNYSISKNTDCPMAVVSLAEGEKILLERGGMVYLSEVELKGRMNSGKNGGFFSALGRSLVSGESFFITEAWGKKDGAELGLAPPLPGKIAVLPVGGEKQYRLNTGAFLACDASVGYKITSQKLGQAVFGGTGGLFIMETEGEGEMLISSFGDIVSLDVSPDRPLVVDNWHVLAWDRALDYRIEAASGAIGFTSGEGFVNVFHGSGRVLVQTRNLASLAMAIRPYVASSNA